MQHTCIAEEVEIEGSAGKRSCWSTADLLLAEGWLKLPTFCLVQFCPSQSCQLFHMLSVRISFVIKKHNWKATASHSDHCYEWRSRGQHIQHLVHRKKQQKNKTKPCIPEYITSQSVVNSVAAMTEHGYSRALAREAKNNYHR